MFGLFGESMLSFKLKKSQRQASGKVRALFSWWIMEKTNKQKLKDYMRNKGKIWVDEPQTLNKRTSGSGVQFGGSYVDKRVGK